MARARGALSDAGPIPWDIVHFHNFLPDGLLLGAWRGARVRIMTNHSSWFLVDVERNRRRRRLRWLTRGVHGIIGPSRELAEKSAWIGRPGQAIEYIPNGVDPDRFTPEGDGEIPALPRDIPRSSPIILSVRRHDPSKSGLPYLIQAMPEVLRGRPEAILCLVGDGPETPLLKRLAADLVPGPSVRFLGRVPNENLPPLYRAACLSVLPSLYEAVSLSGLESLACGRPVIGTRLGGIPEIVLDGRTGILVPPRSAPALATAILDLLTNDDRRRAMGEQGRRLVTADFSWRAVAGRTMAFYRRCLESLS